MLDDMARGAEVYAGTLGAVLPAPGVLPVPASIDREVARLKLAALGVEIDEPTPDQTHYRESWT
jgi:adenosylhomocysteinase